MNNIKVEVNKENFKFDYLADYATYLLNNQITEFVTVGIRFCREVDLPLLKPLSKFSEAELVAISLEGNKKLLTALSTKTIDEHIKENTENWISNTLVVVDKEEITAEDLSLAMFIRRKTFGYFLDAYTKNVVLQKFIITEVDIYTTQEELVSLSVYMQMQKQKLIQSNEKLIHHKALLLEAQAFGGIGSYLTDFKNRNNSFYSPEYKKILNLNEDASYEEFMQYVHPDDRAKFNPIADKTMKSGGEFELEYTFIKDGTEKLIWTKGIVIAENGTPSLIRGTIRDITKK